MAARRLRSRADGYPHARDRRLRGHEADPRRGAETGRRGVPIVAITADTQPEQRDACLAAGCDAHLGKPFTQDDLFDVLLKFLSARAERPRRSAVPSRARFPPSSPTWPRDISRTAARMRRRCWPPRARATRGRAPRAPQDEGIGSRLRIPARLRAGRVIERPPRRRRGGDRARAEGSPSTPSNSSPSSRRRVCGAIRSLNRGAAQREQPRVSGFDGSAERWRSNGLRWNGQRSRCPAGGTATPTPCRGAPVGWGRRPRLSTDQPPLTRLEQRQSAIRRDRCGSFSSARRRRRHRRPGIGAIGYRFTHRARDQASEGVEVVSRRPGGPQAAATRAGRAD